MAIKSDTFSINKEWILCGSLEVTIDLNNRIQIISGNTELQ